MNETSETSDRQNLTDTHNATFLQALEVGDTHCDWLASQTISNAGADRALASHSALPDRVEASKMNATSGPLFGGSYPSAGLQLSLGNRLQARMDGSGCPEYEMTWKSWDMMWGPPICALRASGRRTSGNGCFGEQPTMKHPVPSADSDMISGESDCMGAQMAKVTGWPTTATRDWKGAPPDPDSRGRRTWQLDEAADFTRLTGPEVSGGRAGMGDCGGCLPDGWKTPTSSKLSGGTSEGYTEVLVEQVLHAGWATPKSSEGEKDSRTEQGAIAEVMRGKGPSVSAQAQMAGCPSPRTTDGNGNAAHGEGGPALNHLADQFALPDMTGWKLNPAFSLWLMGYPVAWLWNAPRGTVRGSADLSTVVPLCLELATPSCPR